MKDRTLQILSALIESFIETGAPVASNRLLKERNFSISSATVRNEFSLLEEVGLIESPHVSSGKIPTEKGYRFFVDELLDLNNSGEKENSVISVFKNEAEKYKFKKTKESIFDVLKLISNLSGNVAFAQIDEDQTFYLGMSNFLRSPEFSQNLEKAAEVVEMLEGREKFQNFLNSLNLESDEVKVFIGEDNLIEEFVSCSLVVASFERRYACGKIGVLGPMRMKYGVVRGLLKNVLEFIL